MQHLVHIDDLFMLPFLKTPLCILCVTLEEHFTAVWAALKHESQPL